MQAMPGDPFGQEQALSYEMRQSLLKHHGLDLSYWQQYVRYLQQLSHGELGYSLTYAGRSVNQLILENFPTSAYLGLQALFLTCLLTLSFAPVAALKAGTWVDLLVQLLIALALSVPSFILAALLQYFFSIKWHLFPLAQWNSFTHTLLPTFTLAALPAAFMTRLLRSSLVKVLQMDYIEMAKAKGLHPLKILYKHALRNALLPVLSYLGPLTSLLLVGSFVIETVYSIPGLGQWYVKSITNRDYPMIMGLTLFYAAILMIINCLTDLISCALDPRIRRPS